MKKIIFAVFICSALINSVLFSQTPQTDSKTYSESAPYQPAEFPDQDSKKRKEKKKAKKVDTNEPVKSVIVPVTVLDEQGRIVLNLKKSDFQIFVDDSEIKEFSMEGKDESLNIVLLVDKSPSTEIKIKEIQDLLLKIVENLKPRDRVMVADFDQKLKIRTDFTSDRQLLRKSIGKIKYGNGTSLYDSLPKIFAENINDLEGRTAIILITDGVDTTSRKFDYAKSLEAIEKYDIPVFLIYVDTFGQIIDGINVGKLPQSLPGPNQAKGSTNVEYEIGKYYLNDLVSLSGGSLRLFKDLADSQNPALPNFAQELRLKYYLKFTPTAGDISGERKQIKVRVNHPDLFVFAKGSYIAN